MNNLSQRKCLECNKPLHGRLDKKFCDAYCRNTYNNRHKSKVEYDIIQVNSTIRKNRRILATLCPQGKATVRKEVLDIMGYDFKHFSGLYKSPNGLLYYLVYDYAFSPVFEKNIEKALIVQRQDYMDEISFKVWKKST
ncbi:MAG: hypothetical protein AAGC88_04335 [Bacteroidota bacterium]